MAAASNFPKSFGVLLFPGFELLDVSGPLEALNILAKIPGFEDMKLSLLSATVDPVTLSSDGSNTGAGTFHSAQKWVPTHTFATAPPFDVLLVPGGFGAIDMAAQTTSEAVKPHIAFFRQAYFGEGARQPLKYIISVCNGAMLLAEAGVLDGKQATTNKDGWKLITALGPKTHWVAKARWVQSGNVWTTSGVSAGADGMLVWMESLLSAEVVRGVVDAMEWNRADSADNDPFAERWV